MTEAVIKQHLIDPEICIRCNTCEAICPVAAITHDTRNYVVDAEKCDLCMACIPPCPTGSIDNWRTMPRASAYSVADQLGWDELPAELTAEQLATQGVAAGSTPGSATGLASADMPVAPMLPAAASGETSFQSAQYGATLPPWSAAHPYLNLHGPKVPVHAMTEYRRRMQGKAVGGRLMLFFGARTQQELPYFGTLMKLPKDFIDINLAFSRTPGAPKRYVQDLLRERAGDVAALLADTNTSVFVCGLKAMEQGVAAVLREVLTNHGTDWADCLSQLKREGRIHFETY